MMGPWKSAAGMLDVEITSADPAGALRAAAEQGIPVFEAVEDGDLSVRLAIYRRDWRKLGRLCQKRGDTLKILRQRGVYWRARALLRRPVLLVGVMAIVVLTLYLPGNVYFIRVEGNSAIPDNLILERAEECGIRFGASRRAVRSEKMKNALLEAVPELEWAGVNTQGCVATISVRERAVEAEPEPAVEAGGIVAARDGIIRSCTVLGGNPLCKPGQAVRAGELLVSGYTDYGICIRATPAKAEIYADTSRNLTALTPADMAGRGTVIRSETKYSLIIGKKRINFFQGSGISDTTCVKMTSVKTLTLPGGFALPVKLVVERREWYDTEPVPVSGEDGQRLLDAFARDYLTDTMTAGQILRQERTVERIGDIYCLTGQYACLEMIGRSTSWETLDSYGEND